MNLRETTPWSLIGIAAVLFLFTGTTNAQRLVMLLGRDTGSMELINSGSDPVDVDSYSVTSSSGLLNVEGWNSLTDQGVPGFREANPRDEGLSELALPPNSAALGGGDSVNLGNAYGGGPLTPSEEDIQFHFTVSGGGVVDPICPRLAIRRSSILVLGHAENVAVLGLLFFECSVEANRDDPESGCPRGSLGPMQAPAMASLS